MNHNRRRALSGSLRDLSPQEVDRLSALSTISRQINLQGPTPDVLQQVIETLVTMFSAERGRLKLTDSTLEARIDLTHPDPNHDFYYSRTVVEKVTSNQKSIVSLDALRDSNLASSQSVRAEGIRSVLCAPLKGMNHLLGWIYLDNRAAAGVFLPQDQHILETVSDMLAAAIERARFNLDAMVKTAKLEKALQRLEEANRVKSTFLQTMTHELRTPLTSVIGFSQLLKQDGFGPTLSEQQSEFVRQIETSARKLLNMVDDVINMNQIEAGTITLKREPVSFQATLKQVISELEDEIKRREIDLILPSNDIILNVDATLFKHTIRHLLDNAVKFNRRQGSVKLTVSTTQESIIISITDTGIGIPEETHHLIFEKFRQLDQKTTRSYPGLGLGLTLAREFIRLHGGSLKIAHNKTTQGGTSIELTLPKQPPLTT